MKKIIFIMMLLMMVMSTAEAAKSGDRIARADYTDMSVYINHYPIESYMVGGYAVIPAEELANYCCDVVWSEADWALYITKSETKKEFTAPMVYRSSRPGKFYSDVYKTDIRCIINGTEVPTFNINGRIFITIDDFGLCMDEYTWVDWAYAAKVWLNDKPIKEYKSIPFGTELLYIASGGDDIAECWSGSYDLNYDGKKENININKIGMWDGLSVSIGGKELHLSDGGFVYGIEAVYACDIDSSDGTMDLVVMYRCIPPRGGNKMVIIRYDKHLNYSSEFFRTCGVMMGVFEPYFEVIEDHTFILKTWTGCNGDWCVMRKYNYFNGETVEIIPEYYEILPEFSEWFDEGYDEGYGLQTSEYERLMWKKGFVKVYNDYSSNGINLNRGEYFKPLYDDGEDCVYIVKEDGTKGWIRIPQQHNDHGNVVNRIFFDYKRPC